MKKIVSILAVSIIALISTQARAATADIDLSQTSPAGYYFTSLGTLPTTDGSVFNKSFVSTSNQYNSVNTEFVGQIASNMKITFVYTLTSASPTAGFTSLYSTLSSIGTGNTTQAFNVTALPGIDTGIKPGYVDGGLVLASAALSGTVNQGTTTLTNLTGATIAFSSHLAAFLSGGAVAMNVSAYVSQVPLPAALPLFGLGIASLAGYRAKKKKDSRQA